MTTLQPYQLKDPAQRALVQAAGAAEDAAYDALQAFADALYEEAVLVKLETPEQAALQIRAALASVGRDMARDWVYGAEES